MLQTMSMADLSHIHKYSRCVFCHLSRTIAIVSMRMKHTRERVKLLATKGNRKFRMMFAYGYEYEAAAYQIISVTAATLD